MAKLTVLGSSNSIAGVGADNTHLVFEFDQRVVLVDSPNNPLLKLAKLGIHYEKVTDLIVTHFHPDHISGVPLFLMDMWLRGRKAPLEIYGLPHALDRLENLMDAFSWKSWPDFFPVTFNRLPSKELHLAIETDTFKLYTSEVRHMIPAVGMRLELSSGKVAAYSCDTAPCEEVVNLGKDADILIHEASGEYFGHTSSKQAAELALKAGVKELYLIHYPTGEFFLPNTLTDARAVFGDGVFLAEDMMVLEF